MSQILKAQAGNPIHARVMMDEFFAQFDFDSHPAYIRVEPIKSTLDYKAVFWIWMDTMAKSFTQRDKDGQVYSRQDMHDLICHKFLGYDEPRTIGKTSIKAALKTLTYPKQMGPGDLYDLLQKVEMWCADCGVTLPANPNSDYQRDKEKQVA